MPLAGHHHRAASGASPIVFVSYSHDSDDHLARVRALADLLEDHGADCRFDQYNPRPVLGWARWTLDALEESDYILVVCTRRYDQLFRGRIPIRDGRGAVFEGAIITQLLYENYSRTDYIMPVVFTAEDALHIPLPLRPFVYVNLAERAAHHRILSFINPKPPTAEPKGGRALPRAATYGPREEADRDLSGQDAPDDTDEAAANDDQPGGVVIARQTSDIVLRIDRNFSSYSRAEQDALLEAARALLPFANVRIISKRPGSVLLKVRLDADVADRLLLAADTGELAAFGVSSANTLDQRPDAQRQLRSDLIAGAGQLARAVKSALGPGGRPVIVENPDGPPTITRGGSRIAAAVTLPSAVQNVAIDLIRRAASRTAHATGGGASTSIVLAESILRASLQQTTTGVSPQDLVIGLKSAAEIAAQAITYLARPVKRSSGIAAVAAVAAENDRQVGDLVAVAFDKVGVDGAVVVVPGVGRQTTVSLVDGARFDRGYLSPHFVTSADTNECVLDDPAILIVKEKLSSAQELLPILGRIAEKQAAFLIIAPDIDGEALATLVVNKLRGVLKVCAVRSPGLGDRVGPMLADLAVLTGASPLAIDMPAPLSSMRLEDLGRAKRVVVTRDTTTIIDAGGRRDSIAERTRLLAAELDASTADVLRDELQQRVAMLATGIALIEPGAASPDELELLHQRIGNAIAAARAALADGIVPGGGASFIRARQSLLQTAAYTRFFSLFGPRRPRPQPGPSHAEFSRTDYDRAAGFDVLAQALLVPSHAIADNAGADGPRITRRVLRGDPRGAIPIESFGFDAVTNEFGNLFDAGVVNPAATDRHALLNAVEAAAALLGPAESILERARDQSRSLQS